jgi:hypothetical protein
MFSSIANYINSLVVLAKFYFADNPVRAADAHCSFAIIVHCHFVRLINTVFD